MLNQNKEMYPFTKGSLNKLQHSYEVLLDASSSTQMMGEEHAATTAKPGLQGQNYVSLL